MILFTNVIDYNFEGEDIGSLSYHRIVEIFKFAYAQRLKIGDPLYNDSVIDVSSSNLVSRSVTIYFYYVKSYIFMSCSIHIYCIKNYIENTCIISYSINSATEPTVPAS